MRAEKFKFRVFFIFCMLLIIVFKFTNAFGATINVPTVQHPTIQAGIDAAVDGDTVLVADGTYIGEGNKNLDFNGRAITVKSENGSATTIIDCEDSGSGFFFHNGEGHDSVVSGITIINGQALNGGGISCDSASPTISNCVIQENSATSRGGGIYCYLASPIIDNCTIIDNEARQGGGICIFDGSPEIKNCTISGNNDSGIYIYGRTASPHITNCIISANSEDIGGGGGIDCRYASPTISHCTINNNTASVGGGGIYFDECSGSITNSSINDNSAGASSGGGIYIWRGSSVISGCTINGNSTRVNGGGICLSESSAVITNCIISNNKAGDYYRGGGIAIYGDDANLVNCTITRNKAGTDGGGGLYSSSASLRVVNGIIWGNSPEEIVYNGDSPSIKYSDIQGDWPGEGNINANPEFKDIASGDYQLKDNSPAIGAGTLTGAPVTDIDGDPRPNPADSNPDIGAYENSLAAFHLNVFAMDVGNQWAYDSNIQRRITKIDQTTFPKDTYEMQILENHVATVKEWYETTNDKMFLWGQKAGGSLFKFDKGLLVVWFPLWVGEKKKTSARVVGYPGTTVKMTVAVLKYKKATLSFGVFDAYILRYKITVTSPIGTSKQTFDWWVVPYLGVIKQVTPGGKESLTSFAIGGGTITLETDTDGDGLKDYQELIYNTDRSDPDTDDDGINDGDEVNIHGTDPNDSDSEFAVFAPNGGEIIPSGSNYTIEWSVPLNNGWSMPLHPDNFKLEYSLDKGLEWITIEKDIVGTSYDWQVPAPTKNINNCLVKITGYNDFGKKVDVDQSDAPFKIQVMNVTSPNGKEVLASGGTFDVTWETNDTKNPVAYTQIFCSTNNGKKWKLIATESGDPGTSSCLFPIPKTNEKNCLVKVIAYDSTDKKVAEDESDAPFTIEVVTLTSPNGGETLISEGTHTIEWDTYKTRKKIKKIMLQYTKNRGKTWEEIRTIKGDDPGAYLWTVPSVSKKMKKCKVKIQLLDKKGKSLGSDTSDRYFRIEP